jgi:transcriptional regulator with XRE-family HTH domain
MLDKTLPSLFEKHRKLQKLTQGDIALHVGTSKGNVSRFEKCVHSPTLRTVEKYAQALGFSITINLVKNQSESET